MKISSKIDILPAVNAAVAAAVTDVTTATSAGVTTVNNARDAAVAVVAGDKSTTQGYRNEAETFKNAAAASATTATGARDTAVALFNATGPNAFYRTNAAMVSAFATAPNKTTADVFPDSAKGNRATRYLKDTTINAGAWIFLRYVDAPPVFYIDSMYGSDSNDGLTPTTPFKTFSALLTAAGTTVGVTVYVARGSHFYGELPNFGNLPYVQVKSYGQGIRPIIDGAVNLFTGTWVLDGIYTNTWKQTITTALPQGAAYSAGWVRNSNQWHVTLYDEAVSETAGNGTDTISRIDECGVPRVLNGDPYPDSTFNSDKPFTNLIPAQTTQAGLLTIVNANPGSFTVFAADGSPTAQPYEPRNDDATVFTVYYNPKDGSNPNTNGRTLRITQWGGLAIFPQGADIEDIIFARNGGKDMVSGYLPTNTGSPTLDKVNGTGSAVNCDFIAPGCHGGVWGGINGRDLNFLGNYMRDSYTYTGGCYHNFRPSNGTVHSRGYLWERCRAKRFGYMFYSHTSGDAEYEHLYADCKDAWAEDGKAIMVGGGVLQGSRCYNVKAREIESLTGTASESGVTFFNSYFIMRAGIAVALGGTGGVAKGGVLKFVDSMLDANMSTSLQLPYASESLVSSVLFPTIELVRSTIRAPITYSNAGRCQQHLKLDRYSSLGTFRATAFTNDFFSTGTVVAQGPDSSGNFGAIMEGLRTAPETLRTAQAGVDVGVETGTRRQVWSKTITAADLAYVSYGPALTITAFTDNGNGTANATISNSGAANYGRSIKIAGANTSGADYYGTVTAAVDSTHITIAPVPTGSVSGGKAATFGAVKLLLYKNPVTAYISTDGLDLVLNDVSVPVVGLAVGNVFNVGAVSPQLGTYGPRTIVSITPLSVAFTGAIATTTLTVSAISSGAISLNQIIASGATAGTKILSQLTSTEPDGALGGRGTYTVDTSQTQSSTAMTGLYTIPKIRVDKKCSWLGDSPTNAIPYGNTASYRAINTPTSGANLRALKTAQITWGFPVWQRWLSGTLYPKLEITFVEGGSVTASQTLSGSGGGFVATTGSLGLANVSYTADATMVVAAYNNVNYEEGIISQSIGANVGDVVTLTTEHDIIPWRLSHNSPIEIGGYSPVSTSLVARRLIGYRPSL